MSAFKPYSHLISRTPTPDEAKDIKLQQHLDEATRVPSPDSSAKQLHYSVDELLHRKSKSSHVDCSSPTMRGSYLSSSSVPLNGRPTDVPTTSLPPASTSTHWSNFNLLAHTLWWQNQKMSPFVRSESSSQSEASDNLLSAMTMASAASLYSPHLRRLLLPLSPSASGGRSQRGPRRQRTTFTHEQTLRLEMEYHVSEYISRGKRFQLADLLDLTESQIKIWFQNRRAKDKRIEKAVTEQQYRLLPISTSSPGGIHSSVNDPCSTCDYTANFTASKQLSRVKE